MDTDTNQKKDFLLSNPKSLIMLIYLGGYLDDKQPSMNLIDRGKERKILQEIELIKLKTDKHLHKYPCEITNKGLELLNFFEETNLISDLVENCDFVDPNQFDLTSHNIIKNYIKKRRELPNIWFLDGFPKIGSELSKSWGNEEYLIKINDVIVLDKDQNRILISLIITCAKCNKNYIQEITLDENDYTKVIKSVCSSCSNTIYISHDIGYIYRI